ncbi:MAG: BMP family protein [Fimbriimonadaceae bacterium]
MHRLFSLAMIALLVLVGCSGGAPDGEKTVTIEPKLQGKPVEGEFKVALLTPASVNDSGWSALGYKGLKAIEKDMGATVNQEVTKDASIKDAMRSYAQKGYQLVIGHGFEYNEPGVETAKDFPDTVFVSSSGSKMAPNAGAFRFYLEEGFYLAGMIAGKMTKTGKIGMIGGPDVPSIRSTFMAFEAGAKSVNPSVVVITKFTGKNDDVAAAQQATLQAIDEGADYLIHQANSGVTGFVKACEERKVWCFGANEDQNAMSSQMIGSALVDVEKPFVALAKKVKEGRYSGEVQLVGMTEGAVDFVLNPVNIGKLDPDVKELVTKMQLEMMEGRFATPKAEF